MGFRLFMRNFRSLYTENANVITMAFFGFLFLGIGVFLLRQGSIPGGLLFCYCGVILFAVGYFDLKYKGTPAYGRTITFEWADLPVRKRWVVIASVVVFLLLFCWVALSTPWSVPEPAIWCLGSCEE